MALWITLRWRTYLSNPDTSHGPWQIAFFHPLCDHCDLAFQCNFGGDLVDGNVQEAKVLQGSSVLSARVYECLVFPCDS